MQIVSLPFVVFSVLGLLLFHASRSVAWRRSVLVLLNFTCLSTYAHSWRELLPLLGFLALFFLAVHVVNHFKQRWLFAGLLGLILVGYLHLKRYALVGFLPPLASVYVTAGLSYMIFRVLHVFIDTYQAAERRRDLSPTTLFNYVASFLTFTAGPVQRYEEYLEQSERGDADALSLDDVKYAVARMIDGLFRIALLGPWTLAAYQYSAERIPRHTLAFGAAAVAYTLYIFFNFTGYMGLVIGLGRLFGLRLPENFDQPFVAANFLELWNRWHITVSQWFKTYVFNNLMHFFCSRCNRPAALPYLGVLSYFIVFFILGNWHDWGKCFVVLGLLQGLGVSVNKLWQVELNRLLGRARHAQLTQQLWYQMAARAVGLTYFAMSNVAAWEHASFRDMLRLVRGVGAGGLALNVVSCVLAIMAIEVAVRGGLQLYARASSWTPSFYRSFTTQLVLAAQVVVLMFLLWPDKPGTATDVAPQSAAQSNPLYAARVFYGSNR